MTDKDRETLAVLQISHESEIVMQRKIKNRLVAVLECIEAEGLRNHNTRCRDWWPKVRDVLSFVRGDV